MSKCEVSLSAMSAPKTELSFADATARVVVLPFVYQRRFVSGLVQKQRPCCYGGLNPGAELHSMPMRI